MACRLSRFVRFLCVGSFNTLLDFTILNILVELAGLPVLVANSISVSVGITISYFLNHRIVFRHPQKYSLKNYIRFFFVTGFGVIVLQNLVIYASTKLGIANSDNTVHLLLFNVSDKTVVLNIAKALAVIVGMVWNFLLYKYVVFRHEDDADAPDRIVTT
jgi:putative flippase GtrA